jgi:glutathione peroxidase
MTIRQKILKFIYPLLVRINKANNRHVRVLHNEKNIYPPKSVYELFVELNTGRLEQLSNYRNKKILVVNTASDCGYTNQYEALESLYEKYMENLAVIGFPANDFKEQEKGTDDEIAEFCKINYGVTFPLAKKSVVRKSAEQNEIFSWLSDKHKNGWLDKAPPWNFGKYLINEKGVLTHYFDPAVDPLSREVTEAIQS